MTLVKQVSPPPPDPAAKTARYMECNVMAPQHPVSGILTHWHGVCAVISSTDSPQTHPSGGHQKGPFQRKESTLGAHQLAGHTKAGLTLFVH